MKILAIGDIHGCFFTLKKLIESLDLDKFNKIVFLGDYIDRGENIKLTVDYLMQLRNRYKNIAFLMGNHEYALNHYFKTNNIFIQETKHTINDFNNQFDSRYRDFFSNLLPYFETERYVFSHSKLMSKPIDEHSLLELVDSRSFRKQTRTSFKHNKINIYGHDAIYNIQLSDDFININTGAGIRENGELSAIELPSNTVTSIGTERIDIALRANSSISYSVENSMKS